MKEVKNVNTFPLLHKVPYVQEVACNTLGVDLQGLTWIQSAKSLVTKTREKRNKIRPPDAKNPPLGISTIGLEKWWNIFCKKYKPVWKKYNRTEDQWAFAIAAWLQFSVKKRFIPFNALTNTSNADNKTQEAMLSRFYKARKYNVSAVQHILDVNKKESVIKKVYKEIPLGMKVERGMYYLITGIKFRTDTNSIKDPALRIFLKKQGFNVNSHSVFIKDGNSGTRLEVFQNSFGSLYLTTSMSFSEQHMRLATGIRSEHLPENFSAIVGQLIKSMIKETPITYYKKVKE